MQASSGSWGLLPLHACMSGLCAAGVVMSSSNVSISLEQMTCLHITYLFVLICIYIYVYFCISGYQSCVYKLQMYILTCYLLVYV